MTIRQNIKDALKTGPMTLQQLAKVTGIDYAAVENSKNYLRADGVIRQVPGQKPGAKGIRYELTPIPPMPHHGNVLQSPVWVPPKPLHRPVIHAPGMVVREYITNRVLA